MDDLIAEFVTETSESLSTLDQELVRFEQMPGDKNILGNVFRMMHTIKGTCGFLGLPRLEKVAHAGEDVLGKFRDGGLTPTPESVTLILKCIDQIRDIVAHLSKHGNEGEGDDASLVAALKATATGSPQRAPDMSPKLSANASPKLSADGFPVAAELLAEIDALQNVEGVVVPHPAATLPFTADHTTAAVASPTDVVTRSGESAPRPARKAEGGGEKSVQTIRVNVEVIENLMTLVSEMVLTRNQLLQLTRNLGDSVLKDPIERLSRTTSELQEGVMKTRMQPIGNAWAKLPRIVRDLANELGKRIELVMQGEETELDRQVLELIQDPLTHMVRNSADHGLETPADRVASGKCEKGTIHLSAFHEGGHIIIKIADDGRGINTAKIRAKIVERGLATHEEVAALDDAQVNQYIMRAGFSTAEKVTKVSGRGVGMDVVRTNIEKIGGTIEFHSLFGEGSTFTIKIPLTLAIISSLVVVSSGERFALPQIAVNEVVRVSDVSECRIESLKGAPLLRLRDRLLPLVNLGETLSLTAQDGSWRPGRTSYAGYVVVCGNGSQAFGLIVDQISDAEEIVVKPLSRVLGMNRFFSGNTILGDGRVILILDTNGLAATLNAEAVQAPVNHAQAIAGSSRSEDILLFKSFSEGTKAVPLSLVQRIENFDMSTTEMIQGELVVQYRDHLLPLVSFEDGVGVRREDRQQILVFGEGDAAVGLAIESIVDIVSAAIVLNKPSRSPGVRGSAVIAGRAVDVIEPAYFLDRADRNGRVIELGLAA